MNSIVIRSHLKALDNVIDTIGAMMTDMETDISALQSSIGSINTSIGNINNTLSSHTTTLGNKADKPTVLTSTLSANATSLTISNSAITTSKTYDFYTNTFGVAPTAVNISSGLLTLTFRAQSSTVAVKIVITA